jgi:hypothetical protein
MSVPQQMLAPCPNFATVQPVLFCFNDCLLEDEVAIQAHIIAMWAAAVEQTVQGSQEQLYCMQNYTTAYLDCLGSRL